MLRSRTEPTTNLFARQTSSVGFYSAARHVWKSRWNCSRFHNDRHLRFLLVYVLFGSIRESGAKEASGQRPAVEASQPQSLPESAACGGSMMCL